MVANDPHTAPMLHRKQCMEHGDPIPPEDETGCEKCQHFFASTIGRVITITLVAMLAGLVYALVATPLGILSGVFTQ